MTAVQVLSPENLRVLFLDDDPLVSFAIARLLTKAGFRVYAQRDPIAALKHFRQHPEEFDVLVLDLVMPGMNGLEFARAARDFRPDVPIVLASGNFDLEDTHVAAELGITHRLHKPYDGDALALTIRQACASSRDQGSAQPAGPAG